jgi:hypothetical protein
MPEASRSRQVAAMLGQPFNPAHESTVGVDTGTRCEVRRDEVGQRARVQTLRFLSKLWPFHCS